MSYFHNFVIFFELQPPECSIQEICCPSNSYELQLRLSTEQNALGALYNSAFSDLIRTQTTRLGENTKREMKAELLMESRMTQ